jgi:hypothetical protein
MNSNRLDELIDAWADGRMSDADALELNTLLRNSLEARTRFRDATALHGILHAAANSLAIEMAAGRTAPTVSPTALWPSTTIVCRNMIGLVIGLLIGIVSVSAVWAFASPKVIAVSRTIGALSNQNFEETSESVTRGFPKDFGQWGGDDVEIVQRETSLAADGKNALRFVSTLADSNQPNARALACDLFQLVDLRGLGLSRENQQDVSLELTASFLDARQANSQPSVTFFCQLYLFRGDGRSIHDRWPEAISEAASSGSAEVTTLGMSGWRDVTAKCFVPSDVDFAVVHVAARPNLRVPMPDGLLVDDVRLVTKAQPVLPVQAAREGR